MGSRSRFLTAAALAFALAACGSQSESENAPAGGEATGEVAAAPDAGATGAGATGAAPADAPTAAPQFVAMAASGGMYEVESSQLAKQQAKNADVKAFADMMIRDHTKANEELKAAAGKASPPPTVPTALNPEHQSMLDQLKSAGANFDKTYLDQQRTAHEKTLALLNGYASGGDSQPLKDWASKTKPAVQQHLDKVQQLAGKM